MEKEHVKNRQATEQLLLEAVNRLVEQDGFEGLGINAVATQAGVSKMLIYRYFGSLNGLIAAYIRRYDFWINVRPELTLRNVRTSTSARHWPLYPRMRKTWKRYLCI